jgi:spermidine synthase
VITAPFFRENLRNRILYSVIAGGVLAVFVAGIFLETGSLKPRIGNLIDYRESKYGRIEVHQNEELITLFSDGVPVFSNQNSALAEEVIHYPLSHLKDPEHILLISAVGGMIDELEKHDLASIDYVELDPEVSSILFRFDLLKTIRGLSVINEDGRAYLMRTDKQYDAIIVNLPEPDTFQINRFYTSRFFELVKARLTPQGVFSFTMDGYDNYLAEPQRRKLSSLFNTVSDYFQHVLLLPGQRIFFLCTDSPVHRDIPSLLASKGIATTYISRYFYGNVTDFRIEQLNQQIDLQTEKNDDNSPRLMRLMFTQWFTKFSTSPIWFFGAVGLVLVIYLMRLHIEEYVLFSTGCMTMGCELMIVFAFQIYFGYIYYQIGLIITVFLAGLLPGAWMGERLRPHARRVLVWTDILLISLMLVFIAIYFRMGDKLPVLFYLGTGFLFSVLCGCQFPVALEPQGNAKRSAAGAFSADLIGAALGALITSVLLIPYYGIMGAAVGLILLKMTSLILVGKRHE